MAQHGIHSYVPYPRGIIIPQIEYTPFNNPDFVRDPAIYFSQHTAPHGIVAGVSLAQAIQRTFYAGGQNSLCEPNSRPQMTVVGQKITLRILWPGYINYDIKITVKEANRMHGDLIITRAKLVHEVAKAINRFYTAFANTQCTAQGWDLASHPFRYLFLLELRHVSQNSWQAVLSNCSQTLSRAEMDYLNALPLM